MLSGGNKHMDSKLAYGVTAFIQDRAASLSARDALPRVKIMNGASLLDQLADTHLQIPQQLTLDLSALLDLLDLTTLDQQNPLGTILEIFIGRPGDVIRALIDAKHPADVRAAVEHLFARDPLEEFRALASTIGPFLQRQVTIALSFATTLKNLGDPTLWKGIPEAYLTYFFGEQGFVTLDGIPILPPMHFGEVLRMDPTSVTVELNQLKGLLSEKTAERYVRDLVRITVEAAEDARYGLRPRYLTLLNRLEKSQQGKATRWLKGMASLAEALVTSAVEETILGVAQFQTNALIAASAGTYAGTAARKAAQHVFLSELGE
jgi:hypothetical protein